MKNGLKKAALMIWLVACWQLALMTTASAYIDPSATTYLIQALAGIVIAVGSVAVIFWRRAKNKLKEKAGIDLDRKKETEEDVVAVHSEDQEN